MSAGDGAEHYRGCHPEDQRDPRPAPDKPGNPEPCWHCGTPTAHGCWCPECQDQAGYIPCRAVFHCPACGRWWAYMTGINVISIDVPGAGRGGS